MVCGSTHSGSVTQLLRGKTGHRVTQGTKTNFFWFLLQVHKYGMGGVNVCKDCLSYVLSLPQSCNKAKAESFLDPDFVYGMWLSRDNLVHAHFWGHALNDVLGRPRGHLCWKRKVSVEIHLLLPSRIGIIGLWNSKCKSVSSSLYCYYTDGGNRSKNSETRGWKNGWFRGESFSGRSARTIRTTNGSLCVVLERLLVCFN